MKKRLSFFLAVLLLLGPAWADSAKSFRVIVLSGVGEGYLSAYLVAPAGTSAYLALDAGTLLPGLRVAVAHGSLPPATGGLKPEGEALHSIRGYLLSHPHLDHMAGLILVSPEDSHKPIVGLDSTLDALRDHIFTTKIWSNFGDEGPGAIHRYHLQRVSPGIPFRVSDLPLDIEAFPLSHGNCLSTAFLVRNGDSGLVYCGDTGPDQVEGGDRMLVLWKRIAPMIRNHQLKALFLEASFPDGRSDDQLFGHLTPTWMTRELHRLAREVGPVGLSGLNVVVTHIKPSLQSGPSTTQVVREQLDKLNDLGVRYILPEQGQVLEF